MNLTNDFVGRMTLRLSMMMQHHHKLLKSEGRPLFLSINTLCYQFIKDTYNLIQSHTKALHFILDIGASGAVEYILFFEPEVRGDVVLDCTLKRVSSIFSTSWM